MNGFWTIPNILSISRLPLTIVLCATIEWRWWPAALAVFVFASLTDWLDGYLARRWNQGSPAGRILDPLTDKVLVCSAFVFLVPVPNSGMSAWMAALVIARELLVTGLRGLVEQSGRSFGADWFGKVKMVSQCAAVVGILMALIEPHVGWIVFRDGMIWVMLIATAASGWQYLVRAVRS